MIDVLTSLSNHTHDIPQRKRTNENYEINTLQEGTY